VPLGRLGQMPDGIANSASRVATVNPARHCDSWLLTGAVGTTVTWLTGTVLWTAAIVGFSRPSAWIRADRRGPRSVSHRPIGWVRNASQGGRIHEMPR
jgi:hypothetical protein